MTTLAVIKYFNVIEDVSLSHFSGFIDPFFDPFFFQTAKKGFGNGVDAPMSNLRR